MVCDATKGKVVNSETKRNSGGTIIVVKKEDAKMNSCRQYSYTTKSVSCQGPIVSLTVGTSTTIRGVTLFNVLDRMIRSCSDR